MLHMIVIVQYRAEEQRSPITIVIVPASGEAISAVRVRRKEGGKTAGISLSLSLSLLHFTFDYSLVRVWGEMGQQIAELG